MLRAALMVTGDKATLRQYIQCIAPWTLGESDESVLERMVNDEAFKNAKISFNTSCDSPDINLGL